jgi:two-component system, sensor histidine kinase and response regulator
MRASGERSENNKMQKHQSATRPGLRVLVVDDDPFYRDMAEASLTSAGYEVLTAEDGAQGLDFLRSAHFDLAAIDLTMPGLDGFEVIRRTRSEGQNPNLPIVVMTGTDDIASVEQSFEAGATSFIAKPINWPLFVHHVNFVGRAARAEHELRDAVRTVEFLSNLKSKVLSVLVTESQLPLRTALSMAELLRKEVYGPLGNRTYLEYAEDLYRSLDALSSTQLKLLNAGRALATELLLQEEIVTLAEVVRDAIEATREKAERRGIEIECRIAIPPDKTVKCDRALVNQALKIVLDSAVSFSPRGATITIDARIDVTGAFSFTVADDGPPLPDAVIREILATAPQRQTAAPAASRNTSLTISRVLAEAHQGRIAINSASGEGTIVRLMLPSDRIAVGDDFQSEQKPKVAHQSQEASVPASPVAPALGAMQPLPSPPPALRVGAAAGARPGAPGGARLFGR